MRHPASAAAVRQLPLRRPLRVERERMEGFALTPAGVARSGLRRAAGCPWADGPKRLLGRSQGAGQAGLDHPVELAFLHQTQGGRALVQALQLGP